MCATHPSNSYFESPCLCLHVHVLQEILSQYSNESQVVDGPTDVSLLMACYEKLQHTVTLETKHHVFNEPQSLAQPQK